MQGYPGQFGGHPGFQGGWQGQQQGYGGHPGSQGYGHPGSQGYGGQQQGSQGYGGQQGGQQQQQNTPDYVWMFEIKDGQFQMVAPHDNKTLEDNYQSSGGRQAVVRLYGAGQEAVEYNCNFQTMQRVNTATGSNRTMQRVAFKDLQHMNNVMPPPMAPPPADAFTIQYILKGQGQEQPVVLSADECKAVDNQYRNRAGQAQATANGQQVVIDFSQWKTNRGESVIRIDPKNLPPETPAQQGTRWYFQDEQNNWTPFSSDDANAIEGLFNSGRSGSVTLFGQQKCDVDFQSWVGKNPTTGGSRPIRRVVNGQPNPAV